VHILTKPLPRRDIILAKLGVAVGVTAVSSAVPLFVAAVLADSVRLGVALAVGAVVGSIVYSALFLLLSLLTRRPVLLGLAYILVWEDLLGNLISGTQKFSIEQYVITIADHIAPTTLLTAHVGLTLTIVMSAIFAIGGTLAAVDRLRSFSMAGETS
jgi:ABC-2 type transport system permease protein